MLLIKNNKLIVNGNKLGISVSKKEESNIPEGFVDLGLGVLWATCNLGASSPEGTGLFYSWGETEGHELDPITKELKDGHIFSKSTSNYYSYANDITGTEYDAVSLFYKNNEYNYLNYRMPSDLNFSSLLANTTQTEEKINGINTIKFTSNINGNYIIIPLISGYGKNNNYEEDSNMYLWTGNYDTSANDGTGDLVRTAVFYGKSHLSEPFEKSSAWSSGYAFLGYQIRAVCNIPPKHKLLLYNEKIKIPQGETILAVNSSTLVSSVIKAYTDIPVTIQGLNGEEVFNEYLLDLVNNNREIILSEYELFNHKKLKLFYRLDTYNYIKFICDQPVEVEMSALDTTLYDSGFYKTALIKPNIAIPAPQNDSDVFYRLRYDDYVGYDLKIKWTGATSIKPYIAKKCEYSLSTTSSYLVLNPAPTIAKRSSYTVDSADLDEWASHVDAGGYLYVRFSTGGSGKITFKTEKSIE